MERETIVYNGKRYHRYPESKRSQHRNYFYRHDKNNESPVALHRQIWEDRNGPIPKGMQVHHRDNDFSNNSIENLELLSPGDHRRKHPPTEETRKKFSDFAKEQQSLKKWRDQNPELAKQHAKENGRKSQGLVNWRKENPELARETLNNWRKNNPELAKQHAREAGKKGAEARAKKRTGL